MREIERPLLFLCVCFRAELDAITWLTPAAKQEVLLKLDTMRTKIGYPTHWRDYSGLHLSSTGFVRDLEQVDRLNRSVALQRIGYPVDEALFYWTVPEADGNYNEHLNDVELPTGILEPPRLSASADVAQNYGGPGTFVGHEMTHAFDGVGSQYDEHGNLRNWFTPADCVACDQMTSCEMQEYSTFDALRGMKLDGSLSVGENTTDNGGLRVAYEALHRLPAAQSKDTSLTPPREYSEDQRFFLSFAQNWCEARTPECQRVRGATDPHPPGEFRVNGSVQNLRKFGQAF